jgi:DNA-directed RNA polymerase II subunit RPB1
MNNKDKNISKIIGLQFSILSPHEILKGSVAEIINRDTYINNKPVLGGLFDPRMGVLEPGLICPTDGLDYIQSPGYFGHINLARPVFYIQYLSTVIKILRCICIKCSKLKIDKEKFNYLLNYNGDDRWQKVFSCASKKKRCGEDTNCGCGCLQPKIKKDGLATLIAEWEKEEDGGDDSKMSMKLNPELVIKILSKISDEDVNFMGFSSIFSRPEWMVCQVLAIPPPAIRPSVKHDSQQRSEDDLTHIIVNIIKSNKSLQEKIDQNSSPNIIDDWTTVLQYYISTLIDNKIPGVAAVAQRSGRPLKAIKERLNGKTGRIRGNLMGKRVDFSARSVITPDPNLSINDLGIPLKIAKNLTKPVIVNKKNRDYLKQLILNGPDIYPGAKIYEKKNGDCISLRYVDRESINLEEGDIIHRHIIDGDSVLFNRQPTLHKMSMMCHSAKIMNKGDTFRMNVADTKPYNADFDGDEMNLHMPQDEESEIELKILAAVKENIISPANNKSIIGIFQDSLLSSYLFSQKDINFSPLHAMNLLAHTNNINLQTINFKNYTKIKFKI